MNSPADRIQITALIVSLVIPIGLAATGIAVLAIGWHQLAKMEPTQAEATIGILLLLVLSMQFLLAAMIFPMTNCLLRRPRRRSYSG